MKASLPDVDALKYQKPAAQTEVAAGGELLTVKLRYKEPQGGASKLITQPLLDSDLPFAQAPEDFRFAASAAAFGMVLRGSAYKGDLTYRQAERMARAALGKDEDGYRSEMARLAEKAAVLDDGSMPRR